MNARAIRFAAAAVLAPTLAATATLLVGADRDLHPWDGLTALVFLFIATFGLIAPAAATAHLRGWIPRGLAALGIALALSPLALLSVLVPAGAPLPAVGLLYAAGLLGAPLPRLRDAANEAFPASADLRSLRTAWALAPGGFRLAAQAATWAFITLLAMGMAAVLASGALSTAAAPGTGGLSLLMTLVAGAGLVVLVGLLGVVGLPPLILLSPFGALARTPFRRWIATHSGAPDAGISVGGHVALALLGMAATVIGVAAVTVAIVGLGAVSIGSALALPLWCALLLVLLIRSHASELLAHSGRPARELPRLLLTLLRAHPRELTLAALYQVMALAWLVGAGAGVGLCVGTAWAAEQRLPAVYALLGTAVALQAWVTLRSVLTLALLRVAFVRRLLSA